MKLAFADPRMSYTHAFERYALELAQHMTIKDVAHHLGIGWDATGPLEGTNTKIQLMKRQAYAFLDHEFVKLKIFALQRTKYALGG